MLKPFAIVVGEGLWFILDKKPDFTGFRKSIRLSLQKLTNISQKVSKEENGYTHRDSEIKFRF